MYLFDTDVVSNVMSVGPSPRLRRILAALPSEQQFVSSITVGELVYGAWKDGANREARLRRIEEALARHHSVLAFDTIAARIYGEIRADLENAGTPIGDADTRIAAIALAHDLTVVTGNVRHFERIPALPVESWL